MKRKANDKHSNLGALGRDAIRIFGTDGQVEALQIAQQSLIEWLNGVETGGQWTAENHSEPSQTRILELLNLVKQCVADAEAIPKGRPTTSFAAITRRMRPYASYPTLAFDPPRRRWATPQQPISTNRHPWDQFDAGEEALDPADAKYPYGEVIAAHAILELVKMGALDRIRRCECGTWVFARTARHVSCSSRCRQKRHEATEEFKKKRSVYLKDRYRDFVKGGKAKITAQTKKKSSSTKRKERAK